ncbi:MAG: hypothetical protein QME35_01430 [Thermoanaerobacteraceae bacterium]|nr:hypothetical protein [Thermoanaerobacteraceae bacterium]
MKLEDIFSFEIVRQEANNIDFINSYVRYIKENYSKYKKYKLIISFIDFIQRKLYNDVNYDVIFIGDKFSNLIISTKQSFKVIATSMGYKDRLKFFSLRIPYIPINNILNLIIEVYLTDNVREKEVLLEQIVNIIENKLKKIKPKCIILWNDSLFFERIIIFVANRLKIPTITIQHGIFQFINAKLNDGYFTDYLFVWGNYFREKYIEKTSINEAKIKVLGYPYKNFNTIEAKKSNKINTSRAVFLGQPFESYNSSLLSIKNSIIENVYNACKENNINLYYKYHLGEKNYNVNNYFKDIKSLNRKMTIDKVIEKFDIFISISSTALVETSMNGKIPIQILDDTILSENFFELGVAYTLKNDYEKIKYFMLKIKNKQINKINFNNDYIQTEQDIYTKFKNMVLEIIKNYKA